MRLLIFFVLVFSYATTRAAAPIELELATERGVQITAPHEWLQLLTEMGIDDVRIRAAGPGDEPLVENRGTPEKPRYHLRGVLTYRNELRLPGGTFKRSDRSRLGDYFQRLATAGGEALAAPRGMFGLTEKELKSVFAELTQPIDFETNGQGAGAAIDRLRTELGLNIAVSAQVHSELHGSAPLADDLRGLTAGTGLAMLLRPYGLVLRPEKPAGKPIVYRVVSAPPESIDASTLGKTADHELPHWPVGWELQTTPGKIAPSLFEFLNAEIDGYTLAETLAAIGPRVKIPLYLDHAGLAAHQIDPARIQVRFPRTRTFYKRIIDRVLAQARLGSQVRMDEAGRPFLWIMR